MWVVHEVQHGHMPLRDFPMKDIAWVVVLKSCLNYNGETQTWVDVYGVNLESLTFDVVKITEITHNVYLCPISVYNNIIITIRHLSFTISLSFFYLSTIFCLSVYLYSIHSLTWGFLLNSNTLFMHHLSNLIYISTYHLFVFSLSVYHVSAS